MISNKHIKKIFNPLSGLAIIAPAANNKESPGRKGVTTNPVSAKMIRNSIR
jgi:hypothetical protein